ncbi:MAG: hypothetical protein L0G27_00325 [Paracoccus sp. (in: a-proteobacteria)]|nr:hypothetical protein [Paracoccus sp. (in: a-proteobacteria)]
MTLFPTCRMAGRTTALVVYPHPDGMDVPDLAIPVRECHAKSAPPDAGTKQRREIYHLCHCRILRGIVCDFSHGREIEFYDQPDSLICNTKGFQTLPDTKIFRITARQQEIIPR